MKEHLTHLGGWPTIRGIFAVAGCVALPLGAPLAEAIAHLAPEAILPHLHITVTGTLWSVVSMWLLQGVRSHLAIASAAELPAMHNVHATQHATSVAPVPAVGGTLHALPSPLPRPSLRAPRPAA